MMGDSILLIGIDPKKIGIGTIIQYKKLVDINNTFGTDSIFAEAWNILTNQFGADTIFVLNLDSWDDLKDQDELFQQEDFTYIVPIGLYLTDSYDDIFENKRYYYSQLLTWMCHRSLSTIILTGKHATGFNTLTEYLNYEKQELDTVRASFQNLKKNNIVYVSNCLYAYPYANVILAGMLLGDVGEYPKYPALYDACFDIDWCDVNFDLVFFKNNYLTDTSVENLMNFEYPQCFVKPVTVDRICKYIARHWPDMDEYIGTAFTQYKMTKIYEKVNEYLSSLVGWILYDYSIDGISSVQNPDTTVGIHITYTLWPHFTTEKITDEVIL
jgi:hypothetical protein